MATGYRFTRGRKVQDWDMIGINAAGGGTCGFIFGVPASKCATGWVARAPAFTFTSAEARVFHRHQAIVDPV